MVEKNQQKHVDQVTSELNDREVPYGDEEPIPDKLSPGRLKQEWSRVKSFETRLNRKEKSLDSQREQLDGQESELAVARNELESELAVARKDLESELQSLKEKSDRIGPKLAQLAERERAVSEREEAARSGFAAQNEEQLALLERERTSLRARMQEERREFREQADAERAQLRKELDEAREVARTEISDWRHQHAERIQQLEQSEFALERRERELREQAELLEVERELWAERKDQEVALRSADAQAEAEHFRALLDRVEQQRDELSQYVSELESKLHRLGDEPDALLRRLDEMQEANEKLRDELARRPAVDEAERLRAHAKERDHLLGEVSELRRSEAELEAAVRRQGIAVSELELLRDERDALEQQKAALRAAINDLKEQLGELRDLDDNKLPFPACSSYDQDPDLHRPLETGGKIALPELVRMVQGEMAAAGLFYRELDIQLFLAGLATSRLHLLQGLSGTGKTSLPLHFAKAIGGDSAVVEVQAGWRDRDDLFGYYNAFEGRFYESDFTKAIYRASMPKWSKSPVFIVLDEMNLSHPEQYFGVMLSKLELANTDKARIDLVSRPLQNTPQRFIAGAELPWPSNVWFIGTANHDETTVSFADKTYDRAHVQELPPKHPAVSHDRRWEREPLSTDALEYAFALAQDEHSHTSEKLVRYFREQLAPAFHRLGVSWGNRIDTQLQTFVPVAYQAGASIGDAADHVLTTKIIRKVRDRHDLTPEVLEALAHHIEERWSKVDAKPPGAALAVLEGEVRRMRGEYDDFLTA